MKHSNPPLVSVIVPTKNSLLTIGACLESIRNQTYPVVETIVVDNYSSDSTARIARSHVEKVYHAGPERGSQKNFGVSRSLGEFVLFVDSDMTLTPGVVSECVSVSNRYDAAMIPEDTVGEGFWAACRTLERSCYHGDMWVGAARFFNRRVFNSLGGFCESLESSGDDMDLHQRAKRAGYRLGTIESPIMHHEGMVTPLGTFSKWRYYGRNMMKYVQRNPREAIIQYAPIRPAWVANWRKLAGDPIHTLGFLVLKCCQLAGVVCGHLDQRRSRFVLDPYRPTTRSGTV